jgi:hypothetical protein
MMSRSFCYESKMIGGEENDRGSEGKDRMAEQGIPCGEAGSSAGSKEGA